MTRKQLDQYCEWGVIGLVMVILTVGPLAIGAARPIEFVLLQGLTAVALILWSARFFLNKNHRLLWPPVCWTVIAFLGYAFFRYQDAEFEYVARHEFIRLVVYASLFFIAINNLHKQETTQIVVFLLLGVATLTSLLAVYQFFTHAEFIWSFRRPDQYLERGSGTYICPNHFSGFLEMILPLGLAYLFAGRYNYTFKVFLGYGCLVVLTGIAVTLSRGGWLAAAGSLGIMFLLLLKKRQSRIPALAALLVVGIAAVVTFQKSEKLQERVQNVNEGGSTSFVSARPAIWNVAWTLWQDHFWWGVGPGHFDYRFPEHRPETIQIRPGWVHNDYLNTLVDYGLVGGAVVALGGLLILAGLIQSRKYVDRASRDIGSSRNSNRAAYVLGCIGTFCALGIHSLFDFNLHIPANAAMAAVLAALGASHLRFASGRYWISSWPGSKLVYAVVLLGTSAYLLHAGYHTFREQRLLVQAETLPLVSLERIAAMQQAAAMEPDNFETLYNIGEALRNRARSIDENRDENLEAAIDWFHAAIERYPTWAFSYSGIGMALDQLRRLEEAGPYFEKAVQLEPNQHQIIAFMGWHQVNLGDYVAAKKYFDRSLKIKWWDNHVPLTYLRLIEPKLPPELRTPEGEP